jgi:phosphoglycolate phosphatase
MAQFNLLIFDLDGTLIDSQNDIAGAVNFVRSTYGLPNLNAGQVRSIIGDGAKLLMAKALPDLKDNEIDIATVKFRDYYSAHLLETTRLFPGVRECLDKLKGTIKVLLTNKPEDSTKAILRGLKIAEYFEDIIGGDTSPKKKPDPYHINEFIKKYNMQKSRCLMVGDGKNDILAARAAGIKCAAAQYGYTDIDELNELQPDYSISNISEIINIVKFKLDYSA